MKISKQETIKLVHFLSMAVVFLIAILIFYFTLIQKYGVYGKEINGLRYAVDKLSSIENNSSEFENKKNKIIESLTIVNEKVPLKPMIPQVIEQITKPMNEFGVSLISITPLDLVKKGVQTEMSPAGDSMPVDMGTGTGMMEEQNISGEGYMGTPIELVLQATYTQFGMYLNALRHLSRLIIIDEFEIKSNKDISPKLDIKLKLSVFHYGKE